MDQGDERDHDQPERHEVLRPELLLPERREPRSLSGDPRLDRVVPLRLEVTHVLDEVPPHLVPDKLVAEARRAGGVPVALYVIDIDGSQLIRLAGSEDFPGELEAPPALGPYSQAIVAGGLVFCSGTAGIDPATGVPGDGIEAQTELALRNLDAILTAAGTSLQALVKTTIFYANVEDFATINAIYARFMPDPPPARSAPANVALPRGLLISIDAIAALPSA